MSGVPRRDRDASGILSGLYRHRGASLLHRQAEQDSERLVAAMPVPDPFDLDQLVGNLAAASGRQIVLRPIPAHLTGLDGACGLLVRHDTRPVDLILHRAGRSPSHEVELKVHQLVHLWAGDSTGLVGSPDLLRTRGVTPDGALPVARSLKRDAFIELRADHVARLIGRRHERGCAGGADGRASSGAAADPPGRAPRQPPAGRVTPGARSRHRPRSPPSSH